MTPNLPTPLRLYLIRHGETAWTLTGQHTGNTDIALTSHGEEEAATLVSRLSDCRFSSVLTSPMQRAKSTSALAGLAASAQVLPELSEWAYGNYEGQRSVDIRKLRPDWDIFRDGCPGGESTVQIAERADQLIASFRTLEGNIALFSHGQFLAVFAARWINLPVAAARHFALGTASVSILANDPRHQNNPVIQLWNSVPGNRL